MCAPTFYGFSFAAKKWGHIYVDLIEGIFKKIFLLALSFILFLIFSQTLDVKFDDDAFDQLVMDPTKKELISSLVTSKHKGMDLISGKVVAVYFCYMGLREVCNF